MRKILTRIAEGPAVSGQLARLAARALSDPGSLTSDDMGALADAMAQVVDLPDADDAAFDGGGSRIAR